MVPSNSNVLAFRPLASPTEPAGAPDLLVGPSAAITRVWSQVRRVAPYFRTAFIGGERGSGHAAAARALASLSPRADRPFVTITAASAEETLARPATRWAGDTLFFPDVHLLSITAQHALLRLMRLRRPHQVAVIAASPVDLRPLVSGGTFNSVLAASLSALQIHLPCLRDRAEDIPALATHLLAHEARTLDLVVPAISPALLDALTQQAWPGNLDQLRTALQRLLHAVEPENPDDLPTFVQNLTEEASIEAPRSAASDAHLPGLLKLDDVVQQHIRRVLVSCNGNKLRTAEVLGISRSTLYRMLEARSGAAALPFAV